ncbi:MAG: FecR family protein [Parabacteroides sp.]
MDERMSHIIARVLSGECRSDDLLALSDWLNESGENRVLFTRLKAYWDAEVSFHTTVEPKVMLEQFRQQIAEQQRRVRHRAFWRVKVPMAAAVALLLLLSSLFVRYYLLEDPVEYYTLMTQDHRADFTLEDGTIVTLNSNSRLRYSNRFGQQERQVQLQGEAYFEVAHDASRPFRVDVGEAEIEVLGTKFDVEAHGTSQEVTATLVEGSVCFRTADKRVVMAPDQQLTYDRQNRQIQMKEVNTSMVVAWKEGLLRYRSIPFSQLVSDLRKAYQIPIEILDESLRQPNVVVSGSFDEKQTLEEVLQVVTRSLPIRWTFRDGCYQIRRKN